MNAIFSYIKIGLSLILSYLVVVFFSGAFFIGESPLLRPHPEQYIANKMEKQVNNLIAKLNFGGKGSSGITASDYQQFISTATAESMKQITKGSYAATIKGKDVRIIKMQEKRASICNYTIANVAREVRVLEGDPCPSQQEAVEMFK